jgi:hypothetical protein
MQSGSFLARIVGIDILVSQRSGISAMIDAMVRRTPPPDRIYIKWMYAAKGGALVVFSMKPKYAGLYMAGGPPYRALNSESIVISDRIWRNRRPPCGKVDQIRPI